MLAAKLGWLEDETYEDKSTILGNIGLAGIAIGSMLGSKVVVWNGKKNITRVLFMYISFAMVTNVLKIIENYNVILVGKFLFGLCQGGVNIVLAKIMEDSVPNEVAQTYGMATNFGFCLGIFFI